METLNEQKIIFGLECYLHERKKKEEEEEERNLIPRKIIFKVGNISFEQFRFFIYENTKKVDRNTLEVTKEYIVGYNRVPYEFQILGIIMFLL